MVKNEEGKQSRLSGRKNDMWMRILRRRSSVWAESRARYMQQLWLGKRSGLHCANELRYLDSRIKSGKTSEDAVASLLLLQATHLSYNGISP